MKMPKKKKKAVVPCLRFPEFRDAGEWEVWRLGEIARKRTERNQNEHVTRVLTNSAEKGVIDQQEYFKKDIAVQGNLSNYFVVHEGDFVYNPRISAAAPVGPISRNNVGKGVMSPLYTVFFFDDPETDFFFYYCGSHAWHSYMRSVGSMGARHDRMAISNEDFFSMPLPMPPKPEQQKIADCLASLDDLIRAREAQLVALKDHKKGLMQQLFPREGETTPRLRFPEFRDAGEWEVKRLGEVFIERKERGGTALSLLSVTMSDGVVLATELQRRTNTNTDLSNYKQVKPNDIVYNSMRMWQGASGVSRLYGVVSPAYTIITPLEDQNSVYWSYHFKIWGSIDRFSRFSQGVTSDTWNLKFPAFSSIQVSSTPLPEEQQKIADCLTSLDDLIRAGEAQLVALKDHKKGLMQQLFPQKVG